MSDSTHPIAAFRKAQVPPLTQDELGEKIGVDGMTVSRWERGESLPQRKHWPTIERVTGVTPGQMTTAYASLMGAVQ